MDPRQIYNLHDFRSLARKKLPKSLFAYINNGAEDEASLRWNRDAFERHEFLPKVLVDVSKRAQSIQLFGEQYASPFGISPVGLGALYSFDGDVCLASAAHEKNVPYVLSGASLTRLERVAERAPRTWFQAYLPGDEREIRRLLQRVSSAGIKKLVITVDIPVSVSPDRYARFGFSSPLRPSFDLVWQGLSRPGWTIGTFGRSLISHGMPHLENWRADRGNPVLSASLQKDVKNRDNFTWEHIRIAREHWTDTLVIKGVMSAEDAVRAQDVGADGVIVSNHGGRQADGVAASLDVLEEVVNAVPDLVVMMDGGIRRGSDVLKALGLGARCVFAGRPFNFALAAGGKAGVDRAIELLQEEVDRNMAHIGINHPYEISQGRIRRRA
ncbi:alpha-hydroxy acid oxidase [Achromobacter xylosoxidans]|uniref:alpha-hydroxy acid oxidase n=1 Tax=Alcaligenes xylosoxydans xylosoxydans TaxID=85698 RepID=UPI0009E6D7F2|nr:alpha-hydroxy acid oxidase [Achromobacter xylosoxidans]